MEWLSQGNWVFVLILVAFVAAHLFGHGGHGGRAGHRGCGAGHEGHGGSDKAGSNTSAEHRP